MHNRKLVYILFSLVWGFQVSRLSEHRTEDLSVLVHLFAGKNEQMSELLFISLQLRN